MRKLVLVSTILAILVHSISGLVPLKFAPHDHLLIGLVTAEQLRAHEAAEYLEMQDPFEATTPSERSFAVTVTGPGGEIVSLAPPLSGLISVLHVEIALQLALLLFVPLAYRRISNLDILPQAIELLSLDPPPRRIRVPI